MSLLWLDGEVRYSSFTPFDVRDRGLALGDGLFETVLVVNRVPLWLPLHLERMRWSAEALGIPCDRGKIENAVVDLLAKAEGSSLVLRITLTRGLVARGLAGEGAAPTLLMTLDAFDEKLYGEPVTLATSGVRRNASAPTSSHKTLSYMDAIAAARQAKSRGADDAVMLNTEGLLASSTVANIFLLQGGKLVTPALDQGILPGVTRAVVLKLAGDVGFDVEERPVAPVEIFAADAVFLTNSLRLLRQATMLDGKALGDTDCAPVFEALLAAAKTQCGITLKPK